MEKKLTIEQILPYAAHGLQVKVGNRSFATMTINKPINGDEIHLSRLLQNSAYKPLLLPLSELIPELKSWLTDQGFSDFDINDWAGVVFDIPERMPYFLCNKIFELHGDLFALIDQNLAIDKRTIK